jgi:hypothetical protein
VHGSTLKGAVELVARLACRVVLVQHQQLWSGCISYADDGLNGVLVSLEQ